MPSASNLFLWLVLLLQITAGLTLTTQNSYAESNSTLYDIKEATLGSALIRFSEISGVQFIYRDASIARLPANEVNGQLTSSQALKLLLWNTGYTFEFISDKAIRIFPIKKMALVRDQQDGEASAVGQRPMEEIILLGTRVKGYRQALNSPVPIHVINDTALEKQSFADISESLRTLLPSFSVFAFPGSDGSSLVRPATFRGLPPDQILVLVNGKRRHRSALVNLIGGGFNPLSQGAQGVDFSTIPFIAIKRVEIMHDGSAAQYGSDAIAGVINFILKDYPEGGELRSQFGQYYVGDGRNVQVQTNVGMSLLDDGYFNLSLEYVDSDHTSRGEQRPDAIELIEQGYDIPDPAQRWGNADLEAVRSFWNGSIITDSNLDLYFFGNYEYRDTLTGFFFRHPNDSAVYQQSQYDPDYDLRDRLPNGFTPEFGAIITDFSQIMGLSGEQTSGLSWDLGMRYARNEINYSIDHTINPSLGAVSPTRFKPGTLKNEESGINFDISYPIKTDGKLDLFNIAAGFEYRNEEYTIGVGDEASYIQGPLRDLPIGSNGFQGYTPDQSGTYARKNLATYMDLETEVNDHFIFNLTGRYEHYTDFGDAWAGKLALRYEFNPVFAMRGSYSTGFRAPTTGQSTTSNTSTNFDPGNPQPLVRVTLPPIHLAAEYYGAKPLTPETSDHFTVGFVLTPKSNFHLTLDLYRIRVDDRIGLSDNIPVQDSDRALLESMGVRDARTVSSVRYFTNSFNTETSGADIVASYFAYWDKSVTSFNLGVNINYQKLGEFDSNIIKREREIELQDGFPNKLLNFSILHETPKTDFLLRASYYGSFFDAASNPDYDAKIGSEWVMDFELTYRFNYASSLAFGARNVFDNYPDKTGQFADFGLPYSHQSPFGFNGGFWYLRAQFNF